MKWIKASERMPEKEAKYLVRNSVEGWRAFHWKDKFSQDVEWLDESDESPDTELQQRVKQLEEALRTCIELAVKYPPNEHTAMGLLTTILSIINEALKDNP